MVNSKINPDRVKYSENKELDEEDNGSNSTIYDYKLFGTPIEIALGTIKYTYSRYDIIYYPIYLIIDDEPISKIGVFETDSNNAINIIDADGDIDLKKGNVIIFVSKDYLYKLLKVAETKQVIKKTDDYPSVDNQNQKGVSNKVIDLVDEQVDDEIDVMRLNIPINKLSAASVSSDSTLKPGIFIETSVKTAISMLPEESQQDSDQLKLEYKESSRNTWIEKFMKNNNYNIKDNEGGGDCFFAVVRDAFSQIGQETTIDKIRALLSKEANEAIFTEYRQLYISFLAELQNNETEMKNIKKIINIMKKRVEQSSNKSDNESITKEAKILKDKHTKLSEENHYTKMLLEEFSYMKDIDSLEKFKSFIQTRHFWADTWAISTIERLLNVKIIILSEESYKSGDLDSVLNCGQLNDSDLERQGTFTPDYYIIASYTGNHYKLITYKNNKDEKNDKYEKRILTYREVPYDIKTLIVNKCMEQNSGPYYLIQDFRNLKTKLGLNANEGEKNDADDEFLNKDIYDKDIVFLFHANSNSQPKAGKGSGEKIPTLRLTEFNKLNKITDWRRKLDDSWSSPFTVNGHRWNTVEHYCLASQFKKGFPDFFLQFSSDSGSDISSDLVLARIAGGKTGKTKDRILRDRKIRVDPDYYEIGTNPRHLSERILALTAKFAQNLDLKQILMETKQAKLMHFIRGREPETDDSLMKLRKEFGNK